MSLGHVSCLGLLVAMLCPRIVHVGFVVNKLVVGNFLGEYFGFSISESIQQCFILIRLLFFGFTIT